MLKDCPSAIRMILWAANIFWWLLVITLDSMVSRLRVFLYQKRNTVGYGCSRICQATRIAMTVDTIGRSTICTYRSTALIWLYETLLAVCKLWAHFLCSSVLIRWETQRTTLHSDEKILRMEQSVKRFCGWTYLWMGSREDCFWRFDQTKVICYVHGPVNSRFG